MVNTENSDRRATPWSVNVLILIILAIDIVLIIIWLKLYLFPYSKTLPAYLEWLGSNMSFVIGYIFLPTSVIITVYIALKNKHFNQEHKIVEPFFNWIIEKLYKRPFAFSTLFLVLCILIADCYLLSSLPTPAPPNSGQMVISNYPNSNKYFLIFSYVQNSVQMNGIGIYNRDRKEENEHLPIQYISFPTSESNFHDIAVSHDERYIYATDYKDGTVRIIGHDSLYGLHLFEKIYVGQTVQGITLSADGKKLYVGIVGGSGTALQGKICVFDVIGSSLKQSGVIKNVGNPESLYMAHKTPFLFVASQGGLNNDILYLINTRTDKVIRSISGFGVVSKVIATSNGETAYVIASGNLYRVRNCLNSTANIRKIQVPMPSWRDWGFEDTTFLTASISTIALTPDDITLIIGTSVATKYWAGDEIRDTTFGGSIIGFDVQSDTFSNKKPFNVESGPDKIVIAENDGELYTQMPPSIAFPRGRMATGDSRALNSDKNRSQ